MKLSEAMLKGIKSERFAGQAFGNMFKFVDDDGMRFEACALGAAILGAQGGIPETYEMVEIYGENGEITGYDMRNNATIVDVLAKAGVDMPDSYEEISSVIDEVIDSNDQDALSIKTIASIVAAQGF